jgi:hypothetical protein
MFNNDAQIVTPANLFTEIELTDEQLTSICGGFDHDDHGDRRWHDNDDRRWNPRGERGYWDRWHR